MAEVTFNDVKKQIDYLVDEFDKWTKEKEEHDCRVMTEYEGHDKFHDVSKMLSNILPGLVNNSWFEIDKILYPDKERSDHETSQCANYSKELFERTDMSIYLSAYYLEVNEYDMIGNMLYDYTLLKVVKHLPEYPYHLNDILKKLLDSGNERGACFGLKLLKTVFEGNFAKHFKSRELCSFVSNLKDIPTNIPNDPTKEKIALFIAELAKECYEKFDGKCKVPDINLTTERNIIDSIHFVLFNFEHEMPISYRNFLYNELTSATEIKKKQNYLEWIVKAIATSCRKTLFEGFKVLTRCLLWNVICSQSDIRDNIMRLIDMKYGRNVEPYLPDVDVPIESKKLWNDEVNAEETDYTFEKFFFYDEVMKNLHLLKIFYAAGAGCGKTICEGEFAKEDYTKAFIDDKFILEDIKFYLINRGRQVPWYLEKTLEMCPFVIFPLEQKELTFDLIRVLRREAVTESEELSEKINQILND